MMISRNKGFDIEIEKEWLLYQNVLAKSVQYHSILMISSNKEFDIDIEYVYWIVNHVE